MIWYTPCSGIWQTVWLESTPKEYISKLDLTADMDGKGECFVHTYYYYDAYIFSRRHGA